MKKSSKRLRMSDKMAEVVRAVKSNPDYKDAVITWCGDKIVITSEPDTASRRK